MKLTRKNLKLTKKTLFSFKKQSISQNLNWTGDPISSTAVTPNSMQF